MLSKNLKSKEKEKPKYIDSLDTITKARYNEKVKLIGGIDPYQVEAKSWTDNVKLFPDISYPDIVNYLVNTKSAYTLDDLKAYKSLESYNYFVSGWVKDVSVIEHNNLRLMTARVSNSLVHSQFNAALTVLNVCC